MPISFDTPHASNGALYSFFAFSHKISMTTWSQCSLSPISLFFSIRVKISIRFCFFVSFLLSSFKNIIGLFPIIFSSKTIQSFQVIMTDTNSQWIEMNLQRQRKMLEDKQKQKRHQSAGSVRTTSTAMSMNRFVLF